MATSGVNTLSTSALSIIRNGLRLCGAIDVSQNLKTIDLSTGIVTLNNLVKFWQAQTLHLWKETEGVLFLDVGKTDYSVGPTGDEATTFDDFIETATTSTLAAAITIIPVTSSTGMTAGDVVGIRLDTNVRHWTTIVSVDSSTQIVITAALPSAVTSAATVYTFTKLISRPTRILDDARFRQSQSGEQIPITRWSRQQYFQQTDKGSQGTVVQDYYQPTLINGRYYVWQTASDANNIVLFTFEAPLEVFVDTADNPDFPSEAYLPLSYSLAEAVMLDYKTPAEKMVMITNLAQRYRDDWLGFDQEPSSINLQPQ